MEKLPPTSYVRLVDIWLICGQLIPFLEVILITLRELYNEEDVRINPYSFTFVFKLQIIIEGTK